MANRILAMDATRRAPSVLSGPPARGTPSATTLAAALFLALPLVLGGCGQKGPLRLPEATTPAAKKPSAETVPAPSAASPAPSAAPATAPSRTPQADAAPQSPPRQEPSPGAPIPESRR